MTERRALQPSTDWLKAYMLQTSAPEEVGPTRYRPDTALDRALQGPQGHRLQSQSDRRSTWVTSIAIHQRHGQGRQGGRRLDQGQRVGLEGLAVLIQGLENNVSLHSLNLAFNSFGAKAIESLAAVTRMLLEHVLEDKDIFHSLAVPVKQHGNTCLQFYS